MATSIATILLLLVIQTSAYPSGNSITSVCSTMQPGHGGSTKNINTSPYEVNAQQTTVAAGGSVSVTIRGSDSTKKFRGFMLQARTVSGSIVGSWDSTIPPGTKLQQCSNANDMASHDSRVDKNEKVFLWSAPDSLSEDVIFYCTFVQTSTMGDYWVKVPSAQVTLQRDETTTTTAAATTTKQPTTTAEATQPPMTTAEPTTTTMPTTRSTTTTTAAVTTQSTSKTTTQGDSSSVQLKASLFISFLVIVYNVFA